MQEEPIKKSGKKSTAQKNLSMKKNNPQKRKKRAQAISIVVLILLIFLTFFINLLKKPKQVVLAEAPVYVVKPSLGKIENNYRVTGYVESQEQLTILPKISGAIAKLYVDVEDSVVKGQVVAEIEKEPYELQLRQAEAAFKALQSTWNRISALYQSGGASQQEYEEVKAKFNATEAQYNLARLQLSYCKIRSEIGGIVLKRHDNINIGMLVAPQIPIFTVGQPDRLMIRAKIPEKKFPFFTDQRKLVEVRVEIPAYNQIVEGYIERISPYIEPQSKSFVVYCKVKDKKIILPPGLSVKLNFVLDYRQDVYFVSRRALVGDDTIWIAVAKPNLAEGSEPIYIAQKVTFVPPFANRDTIMLDDSFKNSYIIIEGNDYLYFGQELIIKNSDDYPEILLPIVTEKLNDSEKTSIDEDANAPTVESSKESLSPDDEIK